MHDHSVTRLDPRAPLVLDTRSLPRAPGSMRTVERVVAAPEGLGLAMIGMPVGTELRLDLRLESVSEGVLVSGTVTGPVAGECSRCLRPIGNELAVTVQELFAYPDSTTDATTEQDEVGRLQGDLIDLEPTVRDAVVLALPNSPLCRDDCPGLCPGCGAHWDDLPADHGHEAQADPRWAALKKLTLTEE
ncbi:MAG TPA: YceD family protein [Natronosporangium sp.]